MVKRATGDGSETAEPTPSVVIRAKAATAEIIRLRMVLYLWFEQPSGPFDVASHPMLLCRGSRLDTCDPHHCKRGPSPPGIELTFEPFVRAQVRQAASATFASS